VVRAPIQGGVKLHLILAFANLLGAGVLGMLIGLEKQQIHVLPGYLLHTVYAHAHLAALGWATMMVMGTAYRLFPMVLPAAMPKTSQTWASAVLVELDHVAVAQPRQVCQDALAVADHEHRFEPPQSAVQAPVLGEFHRGAPHVTGMGFELRLQALCERHGIGRAAGEPDQGGIVRHATNLLRGPLHDGIPHGDLPVRRHRDLAVTDD